MRSARRSMQRLSRRRRRRWASGCALLRLRRAAVSRLPSRTARASRRATSRCATRPPPQRRLSSCTGRSSSLRASLRICRAAKRCAARRCQSLRASPRPSNRRRARARAGRCRRVTRRKSPAPTRRPRTPPPPPRIDTASSDTMRFAVSSSGRRYRRHLQLWPRFVDNLDRVRLPSSARKLVTQLSDAPSLLQPLRIGVQSPTMSSTRKSASRTKCRAINSKFSSTAAQIQPARASAAFASARCPTFIEARHRKKRGMQQFGVVQTAI